MGRREKSGVEVARVESRAPSRTDPREPLWEVNARRGGIFRRSSGTTTRRATRATISRRAAITRDDADRFGLGYAPREIGPHARVLDALGFDDERQIAAGLLVVREEGAEPRPRFRGRLMFPIYDARATSSGSADGCSATGEPKYLNSAESTMFAQATLLYGLNWAKQAIRRDERMLVVEGYFDAIRLIVAGIEEVVAPMGMTGFVRRDADADWLRSLGAKAVRGDVFDADGVRRAVALAAPDVVMHQLTDLKGGNRQANSEMRVTGTRNLVDAALAAGVRRVVAQSIAWAYAAGDGSGGRGRAAGSGVFREPAADGAGGGCSGGGGAGGAGVGGAAVRAAVRAGDLVCAGRADGGYRGARGAGGGRGREQLRARGRRGGRGGGRAVVADRVRERVRRRARAGA